MCILRRKVKLPKKGYKVVMLKDGKKYSPATGIVYKEGILISPPKKQRRLTGLFRTTILDPKADHGFSRHMIGRTAVFKHLRGANDLACDVSLHRYPAFETAVFEATVSQDVMTGISCKYSKRIVYAGRRITFGERVR